MTRSSVLAQSPGLPCPHRDRSSRLTRRAACLVLATVITSGTLARAQEDSSPLSLSDLADYRRALVARDAKPVPPLIRFRELWDHPSKYAGTRVQVEGRVVRQFRQGAFGTFPPLVEAWAVTPTGDPFCWVYPAPSETAPIPAPSLQENVRFVGTYLKRIRYQGADVARLAPLIVGPLPPTSTSPIATSRRSAQRPTLRSGHALADWLLALIVAAVAIAIIAWQHLRKPVPRATNPALEPAPQFESPGSSSPEQERPNMD